jgi:hypothetical protein
VLKIYLIFSFLFSTCFSADSTDTNKTEKPAPKSRKPKDMPDRNPTKKKKAASKENLDILAKKAEEGDILYFEKVEKSDVPDIISQIQEKSKNVTTLCIEGNIGDTEMLAIAANLPGLSKLVSLSLKGVFEDVGVSAIVEANIQNLKNLQSLALMGNIGSKDIEAIAKLFPYFERLFSLSLHGIYKDHGAKVIARGLSDLPNIASLSIEGAFYSDGLEALSAAILSLENLQNLRIKGLMDDKAIRLLSKTLPQIKKLRFLSIEGKNFGKIGEDSLLEMCPLFVETLKINKITYSYQHGQWLILSDKKSDSDNSVNTEEDTSKK